MTQATFGDFEVPAGDESENDDSATRSSGSESGGSRGEDPVAGLSSEGLSCPWCLHSPEQFACRIASGETFCQNCEAVIPVNASWYQEGEKIVSEVDLARCGMV